MDGLMIVTAAYGWLGGLIAASLLCLPALGTGVWVLVREPRSRTVLLPLAAQVHHAVCDGFHLCRLIGEVRAWLADGGPAAGGQPGREGAEK